MRSPPDPQVHKRNQPMSGDIDMTNSKAAPTWSKRLLGGASMIALTAMLGVGAGTVSFPQMRPRSGLPHTFRHYRAERVEDRGYDAPGSRPVQSTLAAGVRFFGCRRPNAATPAVAAGGRMGLRDRSVS